MLPLFIFPWNLLGPAHTCSLRKSRMEALSLEMFDLPSSPQSLESSNCIYFQASVEFHSDDNTSTACLSKSKPIRRTVCSVPASATLNAGHVMFCGGCTLLHRCQNGSVGALLCWLLLLFQIFVKIPLLSMSACLSGSQRQVFLFFLRGATNSRSISNPVRTKIVKNVAYVLSATGLHC